MLILLIHITNYFKKLINSFITYSNMYIFAVVVEYKVQLMILL